MLKITFVHHLTHLKNSATKHSLNKIIIKDKIKVQSSLHVDN